MFNMIMRAVGSFNLKKKLIIIFVLLTAVPLVLTTMVTSYLSHSAFTASVYENNSRIAAFMSSETEGDMEAKLKALQVAASSADIVSMNPAQQMPILRRILELYPEMEPVVTNADGMQIVRPKAALISIAERDYFKKVKNGAPFAISDVLVSKLNGKLTVVFSVPIKDGENVFRGALLGVLDLQKLSDGIAKTKIGQTGYVFYVDRYGKILAHPDKKQIEEMTDLSALAPVKATMSGQSGVTDYEYQGAQKLAGYSYLPLTGWGVVAQQPMDEALAGAKKVRNTGIGFTLAAILLAALVGVLAAGVITRPVRELVAVTHKISEGDLTAKASVTTRDEMGQLAEAFNTMVDNLQELIKGVINTADQVAASSEELSATSNEAERAISQIAATITEVAQGAHKQTEEMKKTLQVVDNLTEVSQAAAEKAQSAAALSTEMAAAAETGDGAARNAVDKMTEIKDVTAATADVVTALGGKSKQIGQILDVISEIASQTNLLALNAAIEAARAGEQGRGFSVVAEEVRKLAEQSQEAAQQIAGIVREIQDQTEEAIRTMNSGSGKVNEGVDVVETAGQALQNILTKISNSVSMITDINSASSQQLQGMKEMVSSTGHIAVIARESSASAETTAAASQQVSASMEEIASASEALAQMATELQAMVSKFRI